MPAADPQATAAGLLATAAAARDAGQQAREPMLAASGQVDSAAISRLAAERLRALLGPDAPSTSAAESLPASSTPGKAMISSSAASASPLTLETHGITTAVNCQQILHLTCRGGVKAATPASYVLAYTVILALHRGELQLKFLCLV